MKVVLVYFKDGKRRDFPLTAATTVVGRRSDCQLRIPTGDVSRRHCELTVLDGEVVVRDLGSVNGTFVNSKRVSEHELKPGDELSVGPVRFIVQIEGLPKDIRSPVKVATPGSAADKPKKPSGKPPDKDDDDFIDLGDSDFEIDIFDDIMDKKGADAQTKEQKKK